MAADLDTNFFGDRLRQRLSRLNRSQMWLGLEVGVLLGRQPYSQSAVSGWLHAGAEPPPEVVFAIERVLGVAPGAYSKYLGYLPLTIDKMPVGVEQAILADDDHLTDASKRALLAAYRELKD